MQIKDESAARILHIARRCQAGYIYIIPPAKEQMRVIRRTNRTEKSARSRFGAVMLGALAGMAVGMLLADRGVLSRLSAARTDDDSDDDGDDHDGDHDGDHDDEEDDVAPATRRRSARRPDVTDARPFQREKSSSRPVDDEAELEARVLETFRNDPILMDRPIDIGAIGTGIIELSGWVDEREEIKHATTLTRGTIGVHTVVNRLLVRGASAV